MNNKSLLIFRISLLFQILWGAHAWFTWWIDDNRIYLFATNAIIAIIAFIYKENENIKIRNNASVLFGVISFTLAMLIVYRASITGFVDTLLRIYPVLVLVSDKKNCEGHLSFISKSLAYILIPGIILYIVSLYVTIPGPIIENPNSNLYVFFNKFVLIERLFDDSTNIPRFHSIFLEPGYLGTMLSFLIYANNCDFKKRHNIIMLVAVLLSRSLAGIITVVIGYVLYLLSQEKSILKIASTIILLIIVANVSSNYNNGNNLINESVISRLQYDKEKGISGNNRTGDGTDFYYEKVIEEGDVWFGLGARKVNEINGGDSSSAGYETNIRGTGYKVYIVKNGLLSAILFMMFYYFMAKHNKNNAKYKNGFVLLVILSFLQASYPTSTSWIIPFILGINNIDMCRK